MGFEAKHQSIKKFGDDVAALNDDAEAAINYVNKLLEIDHNDARMFAQIVGKAEEVQQALAQNYRRLGEISRAASTELIAAAKYYQETDRSEAERLDRTY